MFETVQHTPSKSYKKRVLALGTNFAKERNVKRSISIKQLTLLAGVLVALLVAFMLATTTQRFSSDIGTLNLPTLDLPQLSKSVIQIFTTLF